MIINIIFGDISNKYIEICSLLKISKIKNIFIYIYLNEALIIFLKNI